MTIPDIPVVLLPAAGGLPPDVALLRDGPSDGTQFATLQYPGWRQYAAEGFTAESLTQGLLDQVLAAVPNGPVALLGISLGGHFCYALALRLQALGRDVAGVCLLDSFMVSSSDTREGWLRRAMDDAFYFLRKGRYRDFVRELLSKGWRALMRLAGPRLGGWARWYAGVRGQPPPAASTSLFEFELSLRLLLRATAPWVASLDRSPVPLDVPVTLVRTPLTGSDDEAWRRRCPRLTVLEIPGGHQTLFEPENVDALRTAFKAAKAGWQRPLAMSVRA